MPSWKKFPWAKRKTYLKLRINLNYSARRGRKIRFILKNFIGRKSLKTLENSEKTIVNSEKSRKAKGLERGKNMVLIVWNGNCSLQRGLNKRNWGFWLPLYTKVFQHFRMTKCHPMSDDDRTNEQLNSFFFQKLKKVVVRFL